MSFDANAGIPTILFGAFDRHNFGDLLFPHIVTSLLMGGSPVFAGLAARDLRNHGGHRVEALAQLAREWGETPVNILHVGGELLCCDSWQAAIMLQTVEQARTSIARYDIHAMEKQAWVQQQLGTRELAPYVIPRSLFQQVLRVAYNGVGGVDLSTRDQAFQNEVLRKLREADFVGVRDRLTLETLTSAGIGAQLMPDSAVMVAEMFGAEIARHARDGEVGRVLQAFPQGYLAVQFSADFGDDATLAAIASQIDRIARSSGYGVVFFRAGAAPWHDDLACYQRVTARMSVPSTHIFNSLNLWDICSLIAHSQAYCGSSLHGRIVAMAFALPRLNLLHPSLDNLVTKQGAYAATWEIGNMPHTVGVNGIAAGISHALAADRKQLEATASQLCARYRACLPALTGTES